MHKNTQYIFALTKASQPRPAYPASPAPAPVLGKQLTANQLRADFGLTDARQTNAPRRAGGARASRPRILSNYNNPPHYFFRTMFCLSCVVASFALGYGLPSFAYSSMLCASCSSSSSSSASCIIASVATGSCFPTSFFVPFSMFLT